MGSGGFWPKWNPCRMRVDQIVEDPGPSATDRGSGEEFVHPFDKESAEMLKHEIQGPWPLDPRLVGSDAKQEVTLKPEVLAQLQRIEDHLVGLRKTLKSDSLPPGLGPQ